MNNATETNIFFDEFEVDLLKRKLLKGGQPIYLKPKAFDLLLTFIGHRGEVLSKNDLLDLVWENQIVEENNLTVHIAALRKALGEMKNEHRFIITVPGCGYRFISGLNELYGNGLVIERQEIQRVTIEEIEKEKSQTAIKKVRNILSRPKTYLLSFISLLLCLLAGGYIWYGRQKTNVAFTQSFKNFSIKRLTTDGKVTVAALSPDGKLFVYSHIDGEQQSLWLGHVDGGEPVQLRPSTPLSYFSLRFTPDASSIYYSSGDENGKSAIYKIPVFGGAPEKIEDTRYLITFAPDGKHFAFVRRDSASTKTVLAMCEADGKNEVELAASPDKTNFVAGSVAWSPDGSQIAVAAGNETDNNYEILTINTTDGNIKTLTAQKWSGIGATSWLADGSGLITVAQKGDSVQKQLWFVAVPGGEAQHLLTDLNLYGTIMLAANQETLLAVQTQTLSNIWVAPAADLSRAKQITTGSIGRIDGWAGLEWTIDGRLVYTAQINGNNTIWTMNSDGSGQKQLIPSDGNNIYPSLSADNRFLIFQSNRSGKYAVWRAKPDGTELKMITDADIAAQPHISPDGRWVIYVTNPEQTGELWRISIDGSSAPVKLADNASWARISPDSRFVACGYESGGQKIAILPIDGGEPLKLFDIPRLANIRQGIHWAPDGKAITYRDWANGIWRQDLEGGEPKRLKGLPNEKIYAFEWSPDGKWFAFTRGAEIRDVILLNNGR
ncbi:MAG: winged helix-turn-helix domain-containing protein [Actinomycetota bacterium]